MQNLTSDSCSATQISYWGDEISCLSCLVIEIPILGYRYLGFLGFWGYLSTSGAKSDVIWYTVTYRFKCWIKQCSRLFCFSHTELKWRRGGFHPPLSIRCLQKSLAMRGLRWRNTSFNFSGQQPPVHDVPNLIIIHWFHLTCRKNRVAQQWSVGSDSSRGPHSKGSP